MLISNHQCLIRFVPSSLDSDYFSLIYQVMPRSSFRVPAALNPSVNKLQTNPFNPSPAWTTCETEKETAASTGSTTAVARASRFTATWKLNPDLPGPSSCPGAPRIEVWLRLEKYLSSTTLQWTRTRPTGSCTGRLVLVILSVSVVFSRGKCQWMGYNS